MTQLIPVQLFELGYTDLISVVPPNAHLAPSSKIAAASLGKVPGRRGPNGLWAGYNWRAHRATVDDARTWAIEGANVGLRAGNFPGLDIDSLDEAVCSEIAGLAIARLGPAPVRTGKAPKRLLMFRTDTPFSRMRLTLERDGVSHLIEMLGEGQQYLVHGTHPGTGRAYAWDRDIPPAHALTRIDRELAESLFAQIAETFARDGYVVKREGDGRMRERATAGQQADLRAPSTDTLREAVALIPNADDLFPTREDYIKVGYAIKAAAGEDEEGGFEAFADWAGRWDGGENDPATVRSDWRRMHPPFSVGWPYLAGLARNYGFVDAVDEFPADAPPPTPDGLPGEPPRRRVLYSDRWIAARIVEKIGDRLRFVPASGRWLVWDGRRWRHDEMLRARTEVVDVLHEIACEVLAGETLTAAAREKEAKRIESARLLQDVMKLVQADRTIAVSPDALDADRWLLNTPSGVVDLRSGELRPASPDQLCTKLTATGPDFGGACPEWKRFLAEATGGDRELEAYLQRFAGYCLTGVTIEQVVGFVWGPGGNGKTVFVNAVREVMGEYAAVAAMDTFTASQFDKHTTDLADLMGARLVTSSETQSGRRWDEQRLKLLSGGEPLKARFMRQDNFAYEPHFKLLFVGNHKPHVRDLDEAMRRRVHMIPFTVQPAAIDRALGEKLKGEYPAILAWMLEGCRAWLRTGLRAPTIVLDTTAEYFQDEDAVGRWVSERCDLDPGAAVETQALYADWREWCGVNGEYVGSMKRFVQNLLARRLGRRRDPESRRAVTTGLTLKRAEVTFP